MKKEKAPQPDGRRQVTANRRARHEYDILDTWEAGIALAGTEVKSLRLGRADIQDAYCRVEGGEMWLFNMHIAPYTHGNRWNLEPVRRRKLLLHAREIEEIGFKAEQKSLAIVPLSVYFLRGFAKVEIALARGRKLHDKREAIAERDRTREEQRAAAEH